MGREVCWLLLQLVVVVAREFGGCLMAMLPRESASEWRARGERQAPPQGAPPNTPPPRGPIPLAQADLVKHSVRHTCVVRLSDVHVGVQAARVGRRGEGEQGCGQCTLHARAGNPDPAEPHRSVPPKGATASRPLSAYSCSTAVGSAIMLKGRGT